MFNFIQPLTAGVLHSFEPDHVTAVTVLASENASEGKKVSLRTVVMASQWAIGHSITLLLFGGIALIFKMTMEAFVVSVSGVAEALVGPIMIWLGITAIRRNHKLKAIMAEHRQIEEHDHIDNFIHLHGKNGEEIAMNPMNRSFWVGMLHGLAGAGGILTVDLVIQAPDLYNALGVIMIESLGIILAMGLYSYVLLVGFSRFVERNQLVFKWANATVGLVSIFVGIYWIAVLVVDTF
ncbi:hypothetical protein [Xanthovirga aplysinae]|uniref:hypothetical protein n=1 Tax=Xanthovirga aplysinae TaxID=2529853 RepID=UPI0012BCC107|nr:hypothetical protein [Xanthovirga aplysinae]MTI33549.1 hypothetical protein [Xanthovirga aplysinae]